MTNCPNCGAPFRWGKCEYCGTEKEEYEKLPFEERWFREHYTYEKARHEEFPIIGYLNGKPVYHTKDPRLIPKNPEAGTVVLGDYGYALIRLEDGRWDYLQDCDIWAHEKFISAHNPDVDNTRAIGWYKGVKVVDWSNV